MPLNDQQREMFGEFVDEYEKQNNNPGDSLDYASRRNPDTAAEAQRISTKMQVPQSVAESNLPELKRQSTLRDLNVAEMPLRSPKTSEWLKNPKNAEVSYDDIDVLEGIEKNIRTRQRDDRAWYANFDDTFQIGLAKAFEDMKMSYSGETKRVLDDFWANSAGNLKRPDTGDPAAAGYPELTDAGIAEIRQLAKTNIETAQSEISRLTPQNMGLGGQSLRGGVQMLVDNLAPTAVLLATKGRINPLLPYLVSKATFEATGDAMVAGKSRGEAIQYGVGTGMIEGVTEMFNVKALGAIAKKMGTSGVAKRIADWFGKEAIGEQAATGLESAWDYSFGLDEEIANAKTWQDVVKLQLERQIITLGSTVIGGGSMSAGLAGINHLATRGQRANDAALKVAATRLTSAESQDWLDSHIALAQSSLTGQRSPEAFEDYIKTVSEDATVYMPANIASTLESMPEYVKSQLDGTGADVAIGMQDFIRDFVSNEEVLTQVRPYLKVREDLMSLNELEAKVDVKGVQDIIAKARLDQESMTAAEAGYEKFKSQIQATGRQGEHTSRLSAQLMPAYVVAKQAELKAQGIDITVEQIFDDMALSIVGPRGKVPKQDAGAAEPVVMQENTVSMKQDFGDTVVERVVKDDSGTSVKVKIPAQKAWDDIQSRKEMIEAIKLCRTN